MNINNFCEVCESLHSEKTQIFWHGTVLIHRDTFQSHILKPRSLDLGNAFNKPGLSLFIWKTEQEAINWSLFSLLTGFKYWLQIRYISNESDISPYDTIFKKDPMLKEYENYDIEVYWDRNKKITIVPNRDKHKLFNIIKYFEKHETLCYQLKVETRSKYVSFGHTASLGEYTTRDPMTKVITLTYSDAADIIKAACEIVPDNYYDDRYIIATASLLNRGALSFFNTNDFEANIRFNSEDIRKLKTACTNGEFETSEDVIKYIKANNIKIKKLYPIERLMLTHAGKKYLQQNFSSKH